MSFTSLQSWPWYPGQHLHSSSVTVLNAILYVGLKWVRYLEEFNIQCIRFSKKSQMLYNGRVYSVIVY